MTMTSSNSDNALVVKLTGRVPEMSSGSGRPPVPPPPRPDEKHPIRSPTGRMEPARIRASTSAKGVAGYLGRGNVDFTLKTCPLERLSIEPDFSMTRRSM